MLTCTDPDTDVLRIEHQPKSISSSCKYYTFSNRPVLCYCKHEYTYGSSRKAIQVSNVSVGNHGAGPPER